MQRSSTADSEHAASDGRSDERLMQDYAAGDNLAFDRLYQRHRRPLFAFLLRGLGQRALAEECFQEVWSRIVQARRRYVVEAKFSTWMYQIAHHLMIDQFRRQRPVQNESEAPGLLERQVDPQLPPEQSLSDFEQRRRVQRALAELPDDQRLAVQLRLEQELSLEDIASITGVGRETVKSRLRYAMDKLRARLGG